MDAEPGFSCEITLNTALTDDERRRFQNPAVIRRILADAKTIAVVGLSSERQRASHFVATYLQRAGYRVIPVRPGAGSMLGETAYPDLASVPFPLDLAVVFRRGRETLTVADQAIAAGVPRIWFQLRIPAVEAAERAAAAGLEVVLDKCIKMEHGRFGGTLAWAGMNTEIVSARKQRLADHRGRSDG
ncbi:MAG: CoA-binding protein [Gemmatimonadales bacterium]